ncbi:MAG: hypothetical protein N2C12_18465 [Planctomycetales bacterium]
MKISRRHGLRWPHFLLLACAYGVGSFVPLPWDRDSYRRSSPAKPIALVETTVVKATVVDDYPPVVPAATAITLQQGSAFADLVLDDQVEVEPADRIPTLSMPGKIGVFRRDSEDSLEPPCYAQRVWPRPEAIQSGLENLGKHEQTGAWADKVSRLLDQLAGLDTLEQPAALLLLDELQGTVEQAGSLVDSIDDNPTSYQLNAMAYNITRRVDIWRAAHELSQQPRHRVSRSNPFTSVSYVISEANDEVSQVDISGLLAGIEQYEYSRLSSDGFEIASAIDRLAASTEPAQRHLAERLDEHYRNANLRIAASGRLFNQVLPRPRMMSGRVNQRILGIPVWGKQWTKTRLYARLIPDPHRIRIGMEAWGYVVSDTTASSGPVYLYNKGQTAFLVRKLIMIDHDGVKVKRTRAEALGESKLTGIETDYDGVPIFGPLVRRFAMNQADEQHTDALWETEQRVARMARRKFNELIEPRLSKAIDEFYTKIWFPLTNLGVEPTAIGMSTTEQRAVSRLRLGNTQQLTAHTARPRALSNSLLSMQLHESALNNVLSQLDLDGQTINLHDLFIQISKKMDRPVTEIPESMSEKVIIGFAPRDAVRVRCEEGKLKLTIALNSISKGVKYKWSNLLVSADYEIQHDGIQASLVRSGTILLEGNRLRTRDQVILRGVFSKILSRSNRLPLVPEKLASDPQLADLQITQQVIKDGWIGIALGPKPPSATVNK